MNVLFNINIMAVKYQAALLSQKSICPISHTSLVSGCFIQNSLGSIRARFKDAMRTLLPDNDGCIEDECRLNNG